MDTYELTKLCLAEKEIKKQFAGVFACNQLPSNIDYPCAIIANTKPNTHPGQHWVGIYVNKEGYGDYFCSFGQLPAPVFIKWMDKHCYAWNASAKQIQYYFSTACGHYVVFFLYCRTRGIPMYKILDLFTKNEKENDKIVSAFINGMSGKNYK